MNVHVAPTVGHQDHPPEPVATTQTHDPVRRVGVLDRAAMHLGIALIRWGRRPTRATRRERVTANRASFNADELEVCRDRDRADQYLAMRMNQIR